MARVTLTKKELEDEAAQELVMLIQTAGGDGNLTDEEIFDIEAWLCRHKNSDISAIEFLLPIVQNALKDKRITKAERLDIFRALERVVPLEVRKTISGQRKQKEEEVAAAEEAELARERERVAEEHRAAKFIDSVHFPICGAIRRGDAIAQEGIREGSRVKLVPRPNSRNDSAVEVYSDGGVHIGFVRDEEAEEIFPLVSRGCKYAAAVDKMWAGSYGTVPIVDVDIFERDSSRADLTDPKTVSVSLRPRTNSGSTSPIAAGCRMVFICFVITIILFVVFVSLSSR